MPSLLILTVGGSSEPLVYSILEEPRPHRVIFICSEESVNSVSPQGESSNGILAACARRGFTLDEGRIERLILADAQRLSLCIDEMEKYLAPRVAEWLNTQESTVVIDGTGGTKCMSMAAVLVARRWPCTIRYIGGIARTDGGLGRVLSSRETRIDCFNPLDSLGYQLIEDALTLASKMNFESARMLLDPKHPTLVPSAKRSVVALSNLLKVFSEWDRFNHSSALETLSDIDRSLDDLRAILSESSFRAIRKHQQRWADRLKVLADSEGPTRDLVEDLLANAQRRISEGRFDDATARLYRAVEALAQWILKVEFDVDTGNVPPEKLPVGFRDETQAGPIKVGLQDAYVLLRRYGHPAGDAFVLNGLAATDDNQRSPLTSRNQSILAHGFRSIGERSCRRLWGAAAKTAEAGGIVTTELLEFPVLQARFGH